MLKLAIVLAACGFAGAASAATVTFDFASPTGDLGPTHAYTASGLTITASGFDAGGAATDLYGKNDGGDEAGLGLANDPTGDHEIHFGDGFVQLDVSGLFGKVSGASTDFSMNSTTNGEEWGIFGSNTAGVYSGSPLLTGVTEGMQTLPDFGKFKFYDLVELNQTPGQGNNVLIDEITTSAVPEPGVWAMMIAGFFGLGAVLRARRERRVGQPA